jgi:ribosomal protein S27E
MKKRRVRKKKPKRVRVVIKFWITTELGGNKLGIECPNCGNKTVVNRRLWITKDDLYTTRGCTYCGWFFTIPNDILPARDQRRDMYDS